MLGAIIGDIAGSIYEVLEINYQVENGTNRPFEERTKILNQEVPLFTKDSSFTDDTILTCAIYDAFKNGNKDYNKYLKEYGLREVNLGKDRYGRSRFGKGFVDWLYSDKEGTSYGNGAAMRISPIGYLSNSLDEVIKESYNATIPSHNHPDSIKGAEAVASAIFLLNNGKSKEEVIKHIKDNYYCLDYDLEVLEHVNKFSAKSSITVPQAFYIFKVSTDFEDCIRKAISIGGDADTIACIAGSLAEACYGIPDKIKEDVKDYLSEDIYNLIKGDTYEKSGRKTKTFE